ncbi:MAG: DUF1540 domain-containing protein [Bacillota bacterium]
MPKIEVYCTVENCDYWGKNNHCLAKEILIVTDQQATAWPDPVDAPMASNLTQGEAENCMQTACKTFRPRYSHAGPVQDLRDKNAQLAQKYPHQMQ